MFVLSAGLRISTFLVFCIVLFVMAAVFVHAQEGAQEDVIVPQQVVHAGPVLSGIKEWYSTTTITFSWKLPDSVEKVAVDISDESDTEPLTVYEPPVDFITFDEEDLAEGIQYVHVQFKENGEWGIMTHQAVQVDLTPPETFTVAVESFGGPLPRLVFETQDEFSGVAEYVVSVAGRDSVSITPSPGSPSVYTLEHIPEGIHSVIVAAYDHAGNVQESMAQVYFVAGPGESTEEQESVYGAFTLTDALIGLQFIFLVGLLFALEWERRHVALREEELRIETVQVQEQTEKVFSALRDEIYEQIQLITKKKRLSKKEKEAAENLEGVLKVSEQMIKKEATDVRDLLR